MPSPTGAGGRAAREFTSYLGMIIFLGAWAMMFAALFFAYAVVRTDAPSWPPPGDQRLPIALPAVNTAILALSSVTIQLGLRTIRNWRVVELPRWIGATILLGAAFLALQMKVWIAVWRAGLHADSGIYGSVFYGLTCVHALHVVAGLVALVVVFVQAMRGRYRKNRHTPLRMVALFWHFVDVVWLLMFVAVYVL